MKLKKGFTLIELIVVIAIIAILAVVLVPAMLGFVTDARITQANSNAKNIHTAATAWVIQKSNDGETVTPNAVIVCSAENSLTGTMSAANDVDLSKSWGTSNFKGWWGFSINSNGTGVQAAAYRKTSAIPTAEVKNYTKAEQKAMGQHIIGCFPSAG
ncbi:MAG: prepilin-type N-terminal cleavage/methylation domain-containing protein [Oscillospiraceae bacterium]|jgi:prepilin-type N-terminal cleavage/methylation domain-containing protein